MRQEFSEPVDGMIGDAGEDVSEPGKWIDLDALTGSCEATQHRGRSAALISAEEHPVVAADGYTADGALGGVVVNLQIPVFRVACQGSPVL